MLLLFGVAFSARRWCGFGLVFLIVILIAIDAIKVNCLGVVL
jgi:hypothetical protein